MIMLKLTLNCFKKLRIVTKNWALLNEKQVIEDCKLGINLHSFVLQCFFLHAFLSHSFIALSWLLSIFESYFGKENLKIKV